MQSFVLDSEKAGYILVIFLMGCSTWFIFDYFFVHKTSYSIHRILGLSDNIYKVSCVIFIILGALLSFRSYFYFLKLDIQENGNVRLYYLKPRPTVTLHKSLINSYEIKITKANNRVLSVHLKNGKTYKTAGASEEEPFYHSQFNHLIDTLDKIILENQLGDK